MHPPRVPRLILGPSFAVAFAVAIPLAQAPFKTPVVSWRGDIS